MPKTAFEVSVFYNTSNSFAGMCVYVLSCLSYVCLFATAWTLAQQAPQSMEFSRQEYWSVLLCSSPGDLPDPGTEPAPPALAAGFFTTRTTWKLKCASV